MDYLWGFNSPEDRQKRKKAQLYEVGDAVSQFFWDDAPGKFGFEDRLGQQDMAFDILEALKNDQHIAVEAGVGIGKSFAYLVPLLLYNNRTHIPIVIATSTIALQEQLLDDAKRLQKLLHVSQDITLAKGQSHYLCLKRAKEYIEQEQAEMRDNINKNLDQGCRERKDFPDVIPQQIWDKINVTRYSKRTCDTCKQSCFYHALRKRIKITDGIILCNQDLLTAHLINQAHGQEGIINRSVEIVVIDEAHNLEDKVRNATTEHFNQGSLIGIIKASEKEIKGKQRSMIQGDVSKAQRALQALFGCLNEQIQAQIALSEQDMKYAERFFFDRNENSISLLNQAAEKLQKLVETIQIYSSFDSRFERFSSSASDELAEMAYSLNDLGEQIEDRLVWIEKRGKQAELVCCPKNTRAIINKLYFNKSIQTVLTSATLTNATQDHVTEMYSYFVNNTGFPTDESGYLSEPKPSPFPYDEHAIIYYCDDLPHPTKEHEAFIEKGVERMLEILEISHGKALVLFTAKTDMEEVYEILQKRNLPYKILVQQAGSSQDKVLQEFKDDINSVLLGTGAYWEGISIEGKSLSNLVIFRLPFPVPDPIIEYKASVATDPLMDVRVPEMIIKLKQGIGRLIRNFTDTGIVSIIDRRLRDTPPERYHDVTWGSLPIQNRTSSLAELKAFYIKINSGDNAS